MSSSTPTPGSGSGRPERPSTAEHPIVRQIARAGRGTRWHMSRHTLELAINALEPGERHHVRSSKSRRRKRRKRLL